ncbi:unnamed protein product [Leuciscus chuanchicus]
MPKCPKCEKEVYFAERVSSLGKDWHRPCLKCEKCNKTLSAGSHAEVLDVAALRATHSNRQLHRSFPPSNTERLMAGQRTAVAMSDLIVSTLTHSLLSPH